MIRKMLTFRIQSSAIHMDVLWPVLINTIIFGVMATTVATSMQGTTYFTFTMALLVLTGATTSVFQIAVFAEACRLPPRYVQAVMRESEWKRAKLVRLNTQRTLVDKALLACQ